MNFSLISKRKWLLVSIFFSSLLGIFLVFGWLNPLFAQQSPACSKPIECFTLGQQRLQQAQSEVRQQKLDLQEKLKELEKLKSQITDLQNQLSSVSNTVNSVSSTANQAVSKVDSLQSGIQNGSVIAQKALMLKARDDNHWMRHKGVDSQNFDSYGLWRNDDKWFNLIKVGKTGDLP